MERSQEQIESHAKVEAQWAADAEAEFKAAQAAEQLDEERKKWLAGLRPGDRVGVFELSGERYVYDTTVTGHTPGGRIKTASGQTFTANGSIYGALAPCYKDRAIFLLPSKS